MELAARVERASMTCSDAEKKKVVARGLPASAPRGTATGRRVAARPGRTHQGSPGRTTSARVRHSSRCRTLVAPARRERAHCDDHGHARWAEPNKLSAE